MPCGSTRQRHADATTHPAMGWHRATRGGAGCATRETLAPSRSAAWRSRRLPFRVVEAVGVVEEPRVPVIEAGAHVHRTRLPPLLQRLCHRHAHQVHRPPHQRVDMRRDRLCERRDPDASRERRGLVVVVEELRLPIAHDPGDDSRLDLVDHVAVAVVVVPDVFLVQLRRPRHLERSAQVGVVPLRDHVLAIRVQREPQHRDDVVENGLDFRIVVAGEKGIGEQRCVLVAGHLGRVQATVHVSDGLALDGKLPRFRVGQALGMGKPHGDLSIVIEIGQVLGRRDDGDIPVEAQASLPDFDELELVAGGVESLKVPQRLVV